jgi:hypothetical protein
LLPGSRQMSMNGTRVSLVASRRHSRSRVGHHGFRRRNGRATPGLVGPSCAGPCAPAHRAAGSKRWAMCSTVSPGHVREPRQRQCLEGEHRVPRQALDEEHQCACTGPRARFMASSVERVGEAAVHAHRPPASRDAHRDRVVGCPLHDHRWSFGNDVRRGSAIEPRRRARRCRSGRSLAVRSAESFMGPSNGALQLTKRADRCRIEFSERSPASQLSAGVMPTSDHRCRHDAGFGHSCAEQHSFATGTRLPPA